MNDMQQQSRQFRPCIETSTGVAWRRGADHHLLLLLLCGLLLQLLTRLLLLLALLALLLVRALQLLRFLLEQVAILRAADAQLLKEAQRQDKRGEKPRKRDKHLN